MKSILNLEISFKIYILEGFDSKYDVLFDCIVNHWDVGYLDKF